MPLLLLLFATVAGFRQAVPGYHYEFPRDHFDHAEFRTEWWYYTGNVRARDGHRYGFELVFFRRGEHRGPAANPSAWRIDDLYLAHLAVTDIDGRRFRYTTRLNRAGPGIAGISFAEGRIWNGNWEVRWDRTSNAQALSAIGGGMRLNLRLEPLKPAIVEGENGISRKGEGAGNASYYVSFPRLAVEGTLNGTAVAGAAWMDHEWFSNQLEAAQQGWDWFSIQLDNDTELMLFQLRRTDGSIDPYSAGTYIARDGRAIHLKRDEFELQPAAWWTSPKSGARYPVEWLVSVPSLKVDLKCSAAIPDQELVSEDTSAPTYWEGAVTYSGSAAGSGYLEMTGYTRPMRF